MTSCGLLNRIGALYVQRIIERNNYVGNYIFGYINRNIFGVN